MQNKFNINDRVRNKFSKREGYVYSQNPLMVMYNFTQVPIGVSQEHIEFIEEDVCSEHTDVKSVQIGGSHYKEMEIQPIDFITKNNIPYIEGNIIKYICRHRSKNGLEDLEKAKHYLQMLIDGQKG